MTINLALGQLPSTSPRLGSAAGIPVAIEQTGAFVFGGKGTARQKMERKHGRETKKKGKRRRVKQNDKRNIL